MITLRSYQEDWIAGLREEFKSGEWSVLGVLPTGGGKTVCFSYLTSKLVTKGLRVVLGVHRDELVDQISRTLAQFDVRHGLITSSALYDRRLLAHVASIATLARRLERTAVPDYFIVDEAHHAIAASLYGKIIAYWRARNPNLRVIGVTATPERLSGEGLGETFGAMVLGPTPRELIEIGALSRYRLIAPPGHGHDFDGLKKTGGDYNKKAMGEVFREKPAIVGDAVIEYGKLLQGAPSVAFCISIEEAVKTAEKFRAAGYRAASIDGKMDPDERRKVVRDFAAGQLNVLTSCDIVSEGFDVPGIVGAILLRPTWSLGLYMQQVGRALRTAPGKTEAIILDHVGNAGVMSGGEFVPKHGLPDAPREWSLTGNGGRGKGKKDGEDNTSARKCTPYPAQQVMRIKGRTYVVGEMVGGCYTDNPVAAMRCRECETPFLLKARTIEEVAGKLSEVDVERMRQQARVDQAAAKTLEDLIALGMSRGMKNAAGWARHVVQARAAKQQGRAP